LPMKLASLALEACFVGQRSLLHFFRCFLGFNYFLFDILSYQLLEYHDK